MVRRKFVQNRIVRFVVKSKNLEITNFRVQIFSLFRFWASKETGRWADNGRAKTTLAYVACLPASFQRAG
jgi:hypothetical protein